MKKLSIYLETSIWNYVYADDAPEKKEVTLKFFEEVSKNSFDTYISPSVIQEIEQAPSPKKELLDKLLRGHEPQLLEYSPEIDTLAQAYLSRGAIPKKKIQDANHVAYATYHKMDVLLTWNYKHLANVRKKYLIEAINLENGYNKALELVTPYEVIGNED